MVKPRENRVPIMMSDEELASVDDWRFANRVATRSEAVRRLVQIGLGVDRHLSGIAVDDLDLASNIRACLNQAQKVMELAISPADSEVVAREVGALLSLVYEAYERKLDAAMNLWSLYADVAPLVMNRDLEDAMKQVERLRNSDTDDVFPKRFEAFKKWMEER